MSSQPRVEKLIQSKQRVRDLAEVYTAEREVNAMLDLVKDEAVRVDSRFLEPACGNGNFLIQILKRKLTALYPKQDWWSIAPPKGDKAKRQYEANQLDQFKAVSSIYGIDICHQNVIDSRLRLYSFLVTGSDEVFSQISEPGARLNLSLLFGKQVAVSESFENDLIEWSDHRSKDKSESGKTFRRAIWKVLEKNIVVGDTLNRDGEIILSEWSFPSPLRIQERKYTLAELYKSENQQVALSKTIHNGFAGVAHA